MDRIYVGNGEFADYAETEWEAESRQGWPEGSYAESLERDVQAALWNRKIFRDASDLWHELQETRGFSYRPDTPKLPDYGYMVGQSLGHPTVTVRTCTTETIYRFIRANWSLITAHPQMYIGGWMHNEGVDLDLVTWVASQSRAETLGYERGEQAIYDCASRSVIHL